MPHKRTLTVGYAQQRAERACTARDLRLPMALLPDRNPIGRLQAQSESPRRMGSKQNSADPTERPSGCHAVLGPWSLVLGPHSDRRLCHCHPFPPFPTEPMHQSTQDGPRVNPLTDEFENSSKPCPPEGEMPPVQGIRTPRTISEKTTAMTAIDFARDRSACERRHWVPACFSMRNE